MEIIFYPLRRSDLDKLRYWRMSSCITTYLLTDVNLTQEAQLEWFNKMTERGDAKYWVIQIDNEDAGYAKIDSINLINRSGDPGMYIGEDKFRGKGIGTSILMTLQDYAFSYMNLNKLYGPVFADNYSALSSYMKCGWRIEGTLREHCFKYGKFHDILMIALLRKDWDELKTKVEYTKGKIIQ